MRFTIAAAVATFAGVVAANPSPQATEPLAPATTPEGCSATFQSGRVFQIGVVNATAAEEELRRRQEPGPNEAPSDSTLQLTLIDGTLKTTGSSERTAYIDADTQLQFNETVPSNALFNTGFSACSNGTLALESSIWYQCLQGEYYNLFATSQGDQCSETFLIILDQAGVPVVGPETTTRTSTISYSTSTSSATPTPTSYGTALPTTVSPPANTSAPLPYDPNSATSVRASGASLGVLAGLIGLASFFL